MSWLPKDTVLVPVDFSKPSLDALEAAREMVRGPEGLHVVHVLEYGTDFAAYPAPTDTGHDQEKREALDKLRRTLDKRGLGSCRATVLQDLRHHRPGLLIAQHASDINAELIVISTHGHTGLRRLLMGSVAQQVLGHSPCPVLLLPHRHWDEEAAQGDDA